MTEEQKTKLEMIAGALDSMNHDDSTAAIMAFTDGVDQAVNISGSGEKMLSLYAGIGTRVIEKFFIGDGSDAVNAAVIDSFMSIIANVVKHYILHDDQKKDVS